MNHVGKPIKNYPNGSMICSIHKNCEFGDGGSYCFIKIIWTHCFFTKHCWYTKADIYIYTAIGIWNIFCCILVCTSPEVNNPNQYRLVGSMLFFVFPNYIWVTLWVPSGTSGLNGCCRWEIIELKLHGGCSSQPRSWWHRREGNTVESTMVFH